MLDPLSKYEFKAGTLIPGTLVTAIDTDMPGEFICIRCIAEESPPAGLTPSFIPSTKKLR